MGSLEGRRAGTSGTQVPGDDGEGPVAGDEPLPQEDDGREAAAREALLSGSGAGAEGGIVVPWPVLFRHRMHRRVAASERYRWWVLWTVLAGLLSVNITFTVFVVALPRVAEELHTSVSTLTWTSTGPLLAFGVAAPVLGELGDLRGYRRLYLFGLGGAALSVVLTATAPTAGVLIAARLLDGVQGAATGAASMALMLQVFSREDRVKAMGWWALVGAGGPVLGVTIGAPVIQYLGWRALFWGELPLMALAAALALVVLPSDRAGARGRPAVDVGTGSGGGGPASPVRTPWQELDWLGSLLLAVSVTGGLLALNQAPSWGFGNPRTVGLFATSAAFGAAFVLQERRCPSPLVPLRYFRLRNFVFPVGARASVNFAYMGGFFLFPILMERVYGYSETTAGLVSTARPLLFSVVAPIAGYAAVRVGERASVVAGAVSLTASMVLFTQLGADPSLAVILVALALSGVGNGLSTPSSTSSASNELDPSELGVMSAAQQLIAQIGIVAGIQVMVTVQASPGGGAGSLSDFHRAFALAAVVAVLSGVFGLFVRDTPRTRHRKAGAVTVEAPPGSLDADLPLSGSGEAELPRPSEGEGSAEGGPSATVVGPAGPPEGGGPVGRARGSWPSPARSGVVRRR